MIKLNIYSYKVAIQSENVSLLDKVISDFGYFSSKFEKSDLSIHIVNEKFDMRELPRLSAVSQTKNAITYNDNGVIYMDYYGKALVKVLKSACVIYSLDDDMLHELTYLLILSKSGKFMDNKGLHKVHAFGVQKNNINLIGMMPMKGGKTTTFLNLLTDPTIKILSDDTPLVSRKGEILPFPIRVGLSDDTLLKQFCSKDIYKLNRNEYGVKYLLPVSSLENEIAGVKESPKNIFLYGVRSTFDDPLIKRVSKLNCFKEIFKHMVAGAGLPIIVEFFLNNNFTDYPSILKISLSRLYAAVNILRKSNCYCLYLSNDLKKNSDIIHTRFFS